MIRTIQGASCTVNLPDIDVAVMRNDLLDTSSDKVDLIGPTRQMTRLNKENQVARNMLTIELLSDPSVGACPSLCLATVPHDVLDLTLVGIYPLNDELNDSLD